MPCGGVLADSRQFWPCSLVCKIQCALYLCSFWCAMCSLPACWDLLLGSFVPSVLCNPCPVCAVCYVTGWPLIPRPDAVYTIITHTRSARVLHGICCKMVQHSGGEVFFCLYKVCDRHKVYAWHHIFPHICSSIFKIEREGVAWEPWRPSIYFLVITQTAQQEAKQLQEATLTPGENQKH